MSCPLAACCQSPPLERHYSSSQVSETKALGQLYTGAGYGAAVQWDYKCGCGIKGLHARQQYMIAEGGAAVRGDWIRGCSTSGLHAGLRYRRAACGAAVHDGWIWGSCT